MCIVRTYIYIVYSSDILRFVTSNKQPNKRERDGKRARESETTEPHNNLWPLSGVTWLFTKTSTYSICRTLCCCCCCCCYSTVRLMMLRVKNFVCTPSKPPFPVTAPDDDDDETTRSNRNGGLLSPTEPQDKLRQCESQRRAQRVAVCGGQGLAVAYGDGEGGLRVGEGLLFLASVSGHLYTSYNQLLLVFITIKLP